MSDKDPWEAATWDGLRRIQQEEFRRLSFAEKLEWLENMAEVEAALRESRRKRQAQTAAEHSDAPVGDTQSQ